MLMKIFLSNIIHPKKISFNYSMIWRKFYNGKGYDLIYNCLVKEIDEIGSKVKLKLQNRDKNINVKVKNLTICAGGIESIKLILLSLKLY